MKLQKKENMKYELKIHDSLLSRNIYLFIYFLVSLFFRSVFYLYLFLNKLFFNNLNIIYIFHSIENVLFNKLSLLNIKF